MTACGGIGCTYQEAHEFCAGCPALAILGEISDLRHELAMARRSTESLEAEYRAAIEPLAELLGVEL